MIESAIQQERFAKFLECDPAQPMEIGQRYTVPVGEYVAQVGMVVSVAGRKMTVELPGGRFCEGCWIMDHESGEVWGIRFKPLNYEITRPGDISISVEA